MKPATQIITIVFFLVLFLHTAHGQSISSLGTGRIVELECAQSEGTGTLVAASMERSDNNMTRVLIHRSTNNGLTWNFIDSITPHIGDTEIPDPVIASDAFGNFYVAVMRVRSNADPLMTTADIELYRSVDDGQSWDLAGTPHLSDAIADYPQFIAQGNGELYLVYSYITGFPVIHDATLIFKRSIDGGDTWSMGIEMEAGSIKSIGSDITWGFNDALLVSSGQRDTNLVHSYFSSDSGETWSHAHAITIPNGETAHITKPVSNPLYEDYGIISHRPHEESTAIAYHAVVKGTQYSQIIDTGSYAQGYMTDDGIIHVVYNKRDGNTFRNQYIYSSDRGITFTHPVVLYSGVFSKSEFGEYQSLIYGNDGLFYLTFCDWSDNSVAKILVFPPFITSNTIEVVSGTLAVSPNPTNGTFSVQVADSVKAIKLSILDMQGNMIYQATLTEGSHIMDFDISHLESGTYLILCESDHKIFLDRIVKM